MAGFKGKFKSHILIRNYSDHVAYEDRVMGAFKVYSVQLSITLYMILNFCVKSICLPVSCGNLSEEVTIAPVRVWVGLFTTQRVVVQGVVCSNVER